MTVDEKAVAEHGEKIARHEGDIETIFNWKQNVNGDVRDIKEDQSETKVLVSSIKQDTEWMKGIIQKFLIGGVSTVSVTGGGGIIWLIIEALNK